VRGAGLPVALTTNCVYILDLVVGLTMWSSSVGLLGGLDTRPSVDILLLYQVICRIAMFAVFQVTIAYLARKAQARSQAVLVAHVALYGMLLVAFTLLLHTVILALSYHNWGFRMGIGEWVSAELYYCLYQANPYYSPDVDYSNVDCMMLHAIDSTQERLNNMTAFNFLHTQMGSGFAKPLCMWQFATWVWSDSLDPDYVCPTPELLSLLGL